MLLNNIKKDYSKDKLLIIAPNHYTHDLILKEIGVADFKTTAIANNPNFIINQVKSGQYDAIIIELSILVKVSNMGELVELLEACEQYKTSISIYM